MSAPESPPRKAKKNTAPALAAARRIKSTRAPNRTTQSSAWLQLNLLRDITGLRAHDLVTSGISVKVAKQLIGAFHLIDEAQICNVLGINANALLRRSTNVAQTLDPNASDRALRLVSVTSQAIDVFGSQEAAERWLSSPAMGLERRKPIDLLRSTEGSAMVKTLLTRMVYAVYA